MKDEKAADSEFFGQQNKIAHKLFENSSHQAPTEQIKNNLSLTAIQTGQEGIVFSFFF